MDRTSDDFTIPSKWDKCVILNCEKLTIQSIYDGISNQSFIFHSANSNSFNLSEQIDIVIMAPHLVLFEHAAGYALFRSVDAIQNISLLPSAG